MQFSPDSTILTVAQTDLIIFAYKIGAEFGERKSICSKITTSTPPTTLTWPKENPHDFYFGTAGGKVLSGNIKRHKKTLVFSGSSYVVAMDTGKSGKYLVTGHLNGSIFICNLETRTHKKLTTAPSVPYALVFGKHIAFAGNDGKVTFMGHTGNVVQKFDYGQKKTLRDFTMARANNLGETIVVTNYSCFFVYNYNSKRQEWEEKGFFEIENYYSITASGWKPDGSKFVTANLTGSVDVYSISIKKMKFKGKLELDYISRSKIKVLNLEKGQETVITSQRGLEIVKVDVKKDRFVIAETSDTLLLGDLVSGRSSEVEWLGSGNEKFEFGSKDICWIGNAGEVSVVEFGLNEIIGTFRTEYATGKLISATVKYQKAKGKNKDKTKEFGAKKFIAYLLDLQTICILNLSTRITEATIEHNTRIARLSFNTNGTKLLFQDNKKSLYLYNILTNEKQTLLNFCTFHGWVPDSDVIVAQSKQVLNIWYSSDSTDKKECIAIKGTAISINTSASSNKTSITVLENHSQNQIQLDDLLIKFGFSLENKDLSNCIRILEEKGNAQNQGHWRTLLNIALEEEKYFIVERCFAALNDFAKTSFVRKINTLIREQIQEGRDYEQALEHYQVRAKLAMMNRQFGKAEQLYLENDEVEKAIQLYQEIHKWEDSLRIAEKYKPDEFVELKENYYQWLLNTDQEEKAAEIKEKDGQFEEAMQLFLKAGLPVRAGNLVLQCSLGEEQQILQQVLESLKKFRCYEKIGEIYQNYKDHTKALSYFVKSENFQKAINLAKKYQPEFVINLHEKWGDYLIHQNQKENAINHFIEAGKPKKAIEAAIGCHQWNKAIQLLQSFSQSESKQYTLKIANKLRESNQLFLAEKYYIRSQNLETAFSMYIEARKFRDANRFANDHFDAGAKKELYLKFAQKFLALKDFAFAEILFVEMKEPQRAIKMYKKIEDWDKMLKMFAAHRPENLKNAHVLIARKLEEKEQLQKAEKHYVEGGKWPYAITMYEKRKMFEDCIRICKNYASDRDTVERAKKWDGLIPQQKLISLLKKMYLTDSLVDYLCEKQKFDEAFKIAEQSRHKLGDVYLSYAMHLEDSKQYKEAEKNYILAGKFDQVVNMYVEIGDYQNALVVARNYDHELIPAIQIKQGDVYLKGQNYEKMEICYINGRKPELAVNAFLKAQKFTDAMRVAKKHVPHMVREISNFLENENDAQKMSGDEILQQGRIWEDNRDYERAINLYLECNNSHFENGYKLRQVWEKAISLAFNFRKNRYQEVVRIICNRLRQMEMFDFAGEYYDNIGQHEEAAKCFIKVNNFERAKNCIQKIQDGQQESQLQQLFDTSFKNYLKEKGEAEKLIGHEGVADGLEMMISRGDWIQALSIAKSKNANLYNQYLLRFLDEQLKNGKFQEILNTLFKFGMPNRPSNFPIYQKLIKEIFSISEEGELNELKTLLKSFLDLYKTEVDPKTKSYFNEALFCAHLLSLSLQYKKHNIAQLLETTNLSLCRYINFLQLDTTFYNAGQILKTNKRNLDAHIFLNKYLDIYDLIQDPENNILDQQGEFQKCDFPNFQNLEIPSSNFLSENEMLEIRDWLLKIAVQKGMELKLSCKSCQNCSQEIFENCVKCPFCQDERKICYLTGGPLGVGYGECKECGVGFEKKALKEYRSNFGHCPWCAKDL